MENQNLQLLKTEVGDFFIDSEKDPQMFKHLKKYSAQQGGDLRLLLSFLQSGAVVIDVGAHIGTFTVPIAKHVGEKGRVYAIEATKETFSILNKNCQENAVGEQVVTMNNIVSDKSGDTYNVTKNSLKKGNRGRISYSKSNNHSGEKSISLDDAFEGNDRLDLIKIDAEGVDDLVILGAIKLIEKFRPVIQFERNIPIDRVRSVLSKMKLLDYLVLVNIGARQGLEKRAILSHASYEVIWKQHQDIILAPKEHERLKENCLGDFNIKNMMSTFRYFLMAIKSRFTDI